MPDMPTRQATFAVPPSDHEASVAESARGVLAKHLKADATAPLRLKLVGMRPADESKSTISDSLILPASAARILVRVLQEIANGNGVSVVPVHTELTTQEAADLLRVSRPSLIRLLNQNEIEYRKVGSHRRVLLSSVLAYKRKAEGARREALAELVAYDQELGL